MRIGVVTFPGSLDDGDARRAVRFAGADAVALWHGDADLHGVDAVVLPGGFSYGDYLRCGAIARFSPVMASIIDAAHAGLPVLGICNGFQVLCEAHLLPGALTRNSHLHFRNRDQRLRIESTRLGVDSATSRVGQEVVIPVKNGEGRYVADDAHAGRARRPRAASWPATSAATRTARCATSPRSATRPATSSGSCRTRSTRSRR